LLNSENLIKLGEREKERSLSLFPFPYSSKKGSIPIVQMYLTSMRSRGAGERIDSNFPGFLYTRRFLQKRDASSKKSIDIPPKLTEVTTVAIVGGPDTVPLVQFSEKI
jgi:hypothetical protein